MPTTDFLQTLIDTLYTAAHPHVAAAVAEQIQYAANALTLSLEYFPPDPIHLPNQYPQPNLAPHFRPMQAIIRRMIDHPTPYPHSMATLTTVEYHLRAMPAIAAIHHAALNARTCTHAGQRQSLINTAGLNAFALRLTHHLYFAEALDQIQAMAHPAIKQAITIAHAAAAAF